MDSNEDNSTELDKEVVMGDVVSNAEQPDVNESAFENSQTVVKSVESTEQPAPANTVQPRSAWKLLLVILIPVLVTGAVMAAFWAKDGRLPGFSKKVETKPAVVTENKQGDLVAANNQFAFDLYPQLDKGDNLFYSPYSISSAMAIAYEGAKGETANEIKSALHFPEITALRNNSGLIYQDINKTNDNYELATGNALWIDKSLPIIQDYLDAVTSYYKSEAKNVDFVNDKVNAVKTINEYISKQTKEKIPKLLSEDNISALTKLIITNAIYFKSDWQKSFNPDNTKSDGFFYKTDDQTVKTDLMYMYEAEGLKYTEDEKAQILELPYKGNELSMLVMLPKDDLHSIKSLLTADKIEQYRSEMTKQDIETVVLPKFKFDTSYSLVESLSQLGISKAFDRTSADFSNIAVDDLNNSMLYISDIIHKAYIDVNEEGTEAAAATAVIMMDVASAVPSEVPETINFIANRPFVFIIQDNKSGNILFMGKIADPSKAK